VSVLILHTADWQLGKAFGTVGGEAQARLRAARFEAVERVGGLARERGADAVVVAGDVFDSGTAADPTLRRALIAMESFSGPWVLLPGNHDPAAPEGVWERLRRLGLPDNVIVADRAKPVQLADGRLVVLPAPLGRNNETADLTVWFDAAAAAPGAVRVGLAHGSIPSRLPADADARNPIADDRAARAGLDYLALGDWHGTLCIDARTWYSGTPEADRAKDNDPGNALLVRIDRPGAMPVVEPVAVGRYRWHAIRRTVHRREDATVLADDLRALGSPLDRHVVELVLEGSVDFAARAALTAALDDLAARLCDLRVDEAGLAVLHSEDDLQQIPATGFVGSALARLREVAMGSDPQAAIARRALQILYFECRQPQAGH
jgi:DNA repair exonuclease SbcCD nuclease subunit